MYAIIESGGKQQKVKAGDVLRVEKLGVEAGGKLTIDKVLAVNDGKSLTVGTPYVENAAVKAVVTGEGKADKVIIFKFKAKKDYRKKQGHRQPYTEIQIEAIELSGKAIDKIEKKAAAKKKASKKDAEAKDAADEKAADVAEEAADEKAEEAAEEAAEEKAEEAAEEAAEEKAGEAAEETKEEPADEENAEE